MTMEYVDKHKFPKKAFLSRARTSSTSISTGSSSDLANIVSGSGTFSGLDLLADGSEILAKQTRDDSISLADDGKGSFSNRVRDDSLSFASLPDEMKGSFSELEESGINIDDLNFNASLEDPTPSNVTLDLTPKDEDFTKEEIVSLPSTCNSAISSTSCLGEYKNPDNQTSDTGNLPNNAYCNYSEAANYSSKLSASTSQTGNQNMVVSSNDVTSQMASTGSDFSNVEKSQKTEVSGSQTAAADTDTTIGALIKASSNAVSDQSWDTVTELPWADDRLVEEISQVSTTVENLTEMIPRKRRRTSGMSKNKKMDNILCQVCGDLAAGFYCGAYICEACKKFYMRAFKQEKLKYVCLRDKQCVITKESRVQCQYCRYQKCLSLNMYCPKQGSEGDGSKETPMSDIPCRVCSAPSSGFHFGAITCEGCKGFFRRMAKEREPQRYQCSKDGNCEINMLTRNLCKACRYQACLRVGMSVEGSRIGRQSNSVKHEISLEVKQGIKKEPVSKEHHTSGPTVNKERHTSGPTVNRQPHNSGPTVKRQPHNSGPTDVSEPHFKKRHDSGPVLIIEDEKNLHHNIVPVKIKQEPQDFKEDCALSRTQKSSSWEGFASNRSEPVLEHSFSNTGLIAQSFPQHIPSKGKSGTIFMNMLIKDPSQETSGTNLINNPVNQNVSPEVPFSSILSENVPYETTNSQNVKPEVPQTLGVQHTSTPAVVISKKDIRDSFLHSLKKESVPTACSSKGSSSVMSSMIPLPDLYESSTDTSSASDDEPSPQHVEMMALINDTIEAGRCLELINYRKESVPTACSSKGSSSVMSSMIPLPDLYESSTDTSSASDDERSPQHVEMMALINDTIEAGRCLELINCRVFDTDLFSDCKWVVEDVKEKFRNRYMDPKTKVRIDVDMSIYDNPKSAWTHMMNDFNQHAYNTIKFAKSIPGFRSLPISDQSVLLQTSIYPIVLLHLSKVYDPETKTHNYFNFTKEEEAKILQLFPMLRVLVQHFHHVGEIVTTLKLKNEEYALLSAILLLPFEIKGLKEPGKVEELQNKMSRALQYYEENTYQDGTIRYGSLLVRIAELVQCMLQHRLAIGLLLTANPELKHVETGQLFEELVTECTGIK